MAFALFSEVDSEEDKWGREKNKQLLDKSMGGVGIHFGEEWR